MRLGEVETVVGLCRKFGQAAFGTVEHPKALCEHYARIFSGETAAYGAAAGWTGPNLTAFLVQYGEIRKVENSWGVDRNREDRKNLEKLSEFEILTRYFNDRLTFCFEVGKRLLREEISLEQAQTATNAELTCMAYELLGYPAPTVMRQKAVNALFGLNGGGLQWWEEWNRADWEKGYRTPESTPIRVEMDINLEVLSRRTRPLTLMEEIEQRDIATWVRIMSKYEHPEETSDALGRDYNLVEQCSRFLREARSAKNRTAFGDVVEEYALIFSGRKAYRHPPITGWSGAPLAASLQHSGFVRPAASLDPEREALGVLKTYLQGMGELLMMAVKGVGEDSEAVEHVKGLILLHLMADLSPVPTGEFLQKWGHVRTQRDEERAEEEKEALRSRGIWESPLSSVLPPKAVGPKVREKVALVLLGLLGSLPPKVVGPTRQPLAYRPVLQKLCRDFMEKVAFYAPRTGPRSTSRRYEGPAPLERVQQHVRFYARIFSNQNSVFLPLPTSLAERERFLLHHGMVTGKGLESAGGDACPVPPDALSPEKQFEAYFQAVATLCWEAEKRFQAGEVTQPVYALFRHRFLYRLLCDLAAEPCRPQCRPKHPCTLETTRAMLLFTGNLLRAFPGCTRGLLPPAGQGRAGQRSEA